MFVTNIKIMGIKKIEKIIKIKEKLAARFLIVELRLINFYLGLKIEKNQEKKIIKLFYTVFINKILSKFYFN